MILAVDTETNGTDFFHGCAPFLVTACDGETLYYYEGKVNPYNREVFWEPEVLTQIQQLLNKAHKLVFHNANFDMRALAVIGIDISSFWSKIEDTILMAHAIHSAKNQGDKETVGRTLGLKDLSIEYLDYWNDDEDALAFAVKEAVAQARKDGYNVAKEGHPHFPGIKTNGTQWWKMDYWLCPKECIEYGLGDVERTYLLYDAFIIGLYEDNLYHVYQIRKKLLNICFKIASRGRHFNAPLARKLVIEYTEKMETLRLRMKEISGINYRLDPNNRTHLVDYIHNRCGIPVVFTTDTGLPSVDKEALSYYEEQHDTEAIKVLKKYRYFMSKVDHINTYLRWVDDNNRIHSLLNITGTRETRQSSSSPNDQNIDGDLKYLYDPTPGYVRIRIDMVNIELRIWAYLTGNAELIEAFESGQSVHLIITKVLAPLFQKFGNAQQKVDIEKFLEDKVKEFRDTKTYTGIKGGTFSWIYGGSDKKVNQTYFDTGSPTPPNCTALIKDKLQGVAEYLESVKQKIAKNLTEYNVHAIHCMGGYRLDVPTDKPYKASNYEIQGTAGWIMSLGMIEVDKNTDYNKYGCHMDSQVHDSIDVEIPISKQLPRIIDSICYSIEEAGRKIIPTCEVDYKIAWNEVDNDNPILIELGYIKEP